MPSRPFRFYGCANPKGRGKEYNGFEFTEKDVRLAASELVGKPVLIEHEGNPVGEVEAAWVGSDGRLLVVGKTNDNNVRSRFARNLVIDGGLNELSLGTACHVDTDKLQVSNKHVQELSLVERGLRDGTVIAGSSRTERSTYKNNLQVQIQCSGTARRTMSAEANVTAPPSAQDDNTAVATTEQEAAPRPPADPPQVNPPQSEATDQANVAATNENASATQATAQMTQEELLQRVAELTKQNNWLHDKAKRSYSAAFDAAAEEFLANLKVEDDVGKQNLINSLKAMTKNPQMAGPEGNAVMEVVCAASIANKAAADKAEEAFQEAKKLRAWKAQYESSSQSRAAAPNSSPVAPSNNFSKQNNRTTVNAPPARVAQRAATPAAPVESNTSMRNSQPAMFAWLRSGGGGQGMEQMNYSTVAGKDFSLSTRSSAYNQP